MDGRISKAVGEGMQPCVFPTSNIANLEVVLKASQTYGWSSILGLP